MSEVYRDYDPATLKRLQKVLLEMLDDFAALCDKHGLRWWAYFGTAIGALRDGGMLPWDDDIDLCLVREDFEKLLAAVESEMGDKYYVLDAERFPAYPLMTARMCLRGTKFREECMKGVDAPFGMFLDLYCFDHLSDDPREAHRQWGRAWFWGKMLVLRTVRSPVLYFRGLRAVLTRTASVFIHYALRLFTTQKFLYCRAQHWARLCQNRKTERVFYPFAQIPFRTSSLVDEVFPTREVPFSGRSIRVTRDADAALRKIFGDYMVPPPPEARHNHPPMELDFGAFGKDAR